MREEEAVRGAGRGMVEDEVFYGTGQAGYIDVGCIWAWRC